MAAADVDAAAAGQAAAVRKDRHRNDPISFRPPADDRAWLLRYAEATNQPVRAILAQALAEFRERAAGQDQPAIPASRPVLILSAHDNSLNWADDGTYRIETIPETRAVQIAGEAAEIRLDPDLGPREKNALALILGRDAEYRDTGGQNLGWQPDPGEAALVFQIYRGIDSTSSRVTRSQLRRVGYEFRLITRIR
jgi:hypothetical protein